LSRSHIRWLFLTTPYYVEYGWSKKVALVAIFRIQNGSISSITSSVNTFTVFFKKGSTACLRNLNALTWWWGTRILFLIHSHLKLNGYYFMPSSILPRIITYILKHSQGATLNPIHIIDKVR